MADEKGRFLEFSLPISARSTSETTSRRAPLSLRLLVLLLGFFVAYGLCTRRWGSPGDPNHSLPPSSSAGGVQWASCGKGIVGYECANITVPLDYHNASDERTVNIAVTRFPAPDQANRQGAIFLNPGGPGGSGTAHVYRRSKALSTIVKGQFDLIGFDPRGINLTRPYVSCFENGMQAEVFRLSVNDFSLNLPSNVSSFMPDVEVDLERQVEYHTAAMTSLARKCRERTGAEIAFMGTEAVVRDIDILSRIIEGEDVPVNFWGFSYGTLIGQYLIKILPSERIGRVIIDGVVDPEIWSDYPKRANREGFTDIDNVLSSFASSCYAAGSNCSLNAVRPNAVFNFTRPSALLEAIDTTLDSLYAKPVPILDLSVPRVVTASNLRDVLFTGMYSMSQWPRLAELLVAAFVGNFTGISKATAIGVDPTHAKEPDSSDYATVAIFCADTKPYDDEVPMPSSAELTKMVLESLKVYSSRMGDRVYWLSLCHVWDSAGLSPRKSRYDGPFDMEDDVLSTPILILSNTFDPVTPIASAAYTNDRLWNNARLIQQRDGWGHCSLSQVSYCTARAVRAYMVHGRAPDAKETMCDVDQLPWQPFEDQLVIEDVEERELRKAWRELAENWVRG